MASVAQLKGLEPERGIRCLWVIPFPLLHVCYKMYVYVSVISFQLLLSVLIYMCTCTSRDNVYFNHACAVMCVGMCVCYIISAILPALTQRPSDSVHLDQACVVCMCVCMINICMYISIHMHIHIYIYNYCYLFCFQAYSK